MERQPTARLAGERTGGRISPARRPRREPPPAPNPGDLRRTIHDALHRGRIFHHFQPIWAIGGNLLGFEALARFPDGAPPALVWAAAQEDGSWRQLDRASLRFALAAAQGLPGSLFCNISPRHAGRTWGGGPSPEVTAVVTAHRPDRSLVFELTEDEEVSREVIKRCVATLRSRGYLTALDDAGTRGGTGERLLLVRPAYVKLDRSLLLAWLDGHPEALRRWIALAAGIGARTIAEGVEDAGCLPGLATEGVDYVQGFAFGRPQPADTWTTAALDAVRPAPVAERPT